MSLREYGRKRRFGQTPEPADDGAGPRRGKRPIFVVQLHHARARHYDFRLEVDGALKSWAVPKGPSLRAGEKRLAVQVEDHPLAYASFEGDIPAGHYGAGHVDVFDHGVWNSDGDPLSAIAAGKLDFELHGGKLRGGWKLVRTQLRGGKPNWLLIKRDDAQAMDLEADDLLGNEALSPRKSSKASATKKNSSAAKGIRAKSTPRRKDWAALAAKLDGARKRALPAGFKPQLSTQRESAPAGDGWLHEIKWDGYRMLADLDAGKVKLRSRNGLDWSSDFPEIVDALQALPVVDARFDGELVVLDKLGRSDFAALQRTLEGCAKAALRYVLFDLPAIAGVDLTATPLLQRKQLLETLIANDSSDQLAYSQHVVGHGAEVFEASGKHGLEGIISKRVDAPYVSGRASSWVKVKHAHSDEFVIVGYTAPKGSRQGFGSLLMAARADDGLRYVGRVGTGYDDALLKSLTRQLQGLQREQAVVTLPAHVPFRAASVHWVAPQLVAEVAYRGWGKEGLLRQASFLRLRDDKSVQEVAMVKTTGKASEAAKSTTVISHPERVVFPGRKGEALSKGEVADYYRAVAPYLLQDIGGRPLSLLRCPDGLKGPCFFQKHHNDALGSHVHAVALKEKGGDGVRCVTVDDVEGVLELVQMNTLEFHPWGARGDDPEHPDRLVFDLDPGDGVAWKTVCAAARELRARLEDTGLQSWLRLSGGKGVHLVVPIRRGPSWTQAKDFCEAFADAMSVYKPQTYLATASKARRKGLIFIDWLRNARGATSVASWSLRARAGAPVAMPIRWEELGRVGRPDAYDLRRALRRAKTLKVDPWDGFAQCQQGLPKSG